MKIYQSNLLNNFSNLIHAFTTKSGGVSLKQYKSLNLAFHVNDDEELVKKNHQLLANHLNYQMNSLVHMKQIHSNIVHMITDTDNFLNPPICDALITDKVDIPLMVMVADCSPILFYDDKKKVIAIAHAGRQGAFTNIVKNVITSFQNNYNSNVENISVSIGASICQNCYEVGSQIYEESKELKLAYAMIKKESKYYLDIREILKNQLLNAGVKETRIEISAECSCCKNEQYFSYRADGVTGRFCGVIQLNK